MVGLKCAGVTKRKKLSVHNATLVSIFLVLASVARADALGQPPDAAVAVELGMLANAVAEIRDDAPVDRERLGNAISEFLQRSADLPLASGIILGDNWKIAAPDQQDDFSGALGNLAVTLLSDVVLDVRYDLIEVEHIDGDADNLPVRVRLVVPLQDNSIVEFNLMLHNKRGDWRIFDVVAAGISYLKNLRAELRQEVAVHGLDKAIERFIAIHR
jgi:phospholipid transport system substrate-binding protein